MAASVTLGAVVLSAVASVAGATTSTISGIQQNKEMKRKSREQQAQVQSSLHQQENRKLLEAEALKRDAARRKQLQSQGLYSGRAGTILGGPPPSSAGVNANSPGVYTGGGTDLLGQ